MNDLLKTEVTPEAAGIQKRKPGELYKLLQTTSMDDIIETVLSRPDGLNHLLMSDIDILMNDIKTDFPDITKVFSIGKSTSGRDINVLEISDSMG